MLSTFSIILFTSESMWIFSKILVTFVNSTHLLCPSCMSQTIDALHALSCCLCIRLLWVPSFNALSGYVIVSILHFTGSWFTIPKFIILIWFTLWAELECYNFDINVNSWPIKMGSMVCVARIPSWVACSLNSAEGFPWCSLHHFLVSLLLFCSVFYLLLLLL